jgi:hypothetical protein
LKIKALPSFHTVVTARPPTQPHIPAPLNHTAVKNSNLESF